MRIIQAIRFIMTNKGVSLVETIIATAILSIIAIPLLAGLSQSFKNYNSSYQYYMASVEVRNIVMEISTALSAGNAVSERSVSNGSGVDGFKYAVHIGRILGDTLYEWTSYSSGDIFPLPNISMGSDKYADTAQGYVIVIDIYKNEDTLVKRVVQPVWV